MQVRGKRMRQKNFDRQSLRISDTPANRWLLIAAGSVLALAVRWVCRDFESFDVDNWVIPWYNYIKSSGVRALGVEIPSPNIRGNYTPPYYYLLYIATFFDGVAPKLYLIKAVSVLFDLVASIFVFKIVRLGGQSRTRAWLALFAVLLAPTVIANGALWGQSDVIWASLLLGSVYFSLTCSPFLVVLFFGLALSVKAQGVFLIPYLLLLVAVYRLPWKELSLIPVVYFAVMTPAILTGRSPIDVLLVYLRQGSFFDQLSMNAPNLYYFATYRYLASNTYYLIGTFLGITITVLVSLLFAWRSRSRRATLTPQFLVFSATVSLTLAPFLLPKMHDRYFFAADLCSIALAFLVPRLWFVPVALQISSTLAYVPFLSGGHGYKVMPIAVFINTALVCYLVTVYVAATQRDLADRALRRRCRLINTQNRGLYGIEP
jgi:Gpi18-like mannosyltransferase